MKKRFLLLSVFVLIVGAFAGCGDSGNQPGMCEMIETTYKNQKEDIFIGEVSIKDYAVTYKGYAAKGCAEFLADLIQGAVGKEILWYKLNNDAPQNRIEVIIDENLQEESVTEIKDGVITIKGVTNTALYNEIMCFANTYLGWMYAGTADQKISDTRKVIHIPATIETSEAWIEKREPIVTLWNTNLVRGNSYNMNASTQMDILTYSDEQLYEYVKMLKQCGYTGIQVTDMCASWTAVSGYEFGQERIRFMANAAHSLGMDFTLWVWAANFDGFGYVDKDVTYDKGDYEYQYQNPDVVACFEKYYDIYTELADVSDRVICHFYDPGNLETAQDVGFFAKMLMDKMKAVNPEIDFGISCWVDAFDVGTILSYTGTDVTIYEGNCQTEGGIDGHLRQNAVTFDTRLGTWSWNTCGMEIDQLAAMQYNSHVIKETYDQMRQYDSIKKPEYWSEMDSYHVLNAFSLYCAAAMLQNPDRTPEEVTKEVATAFVGPEWADYFAEILWLIETSRSGKNWDEYWWNSPNYVLVNSDYDAGVIITECDLLLLYLEEMVIQDAESYYVTTPIPMSEIAELMIPQIMQIREYAMFRYNFGQLVKDYEKTGDKTAAAEKLKTIATPIPEYNAVIGVWGQIEARQQRILVLDFCEANDIEIPIYPYYDRMRKNRMVDALIMQQKGHEEMVSTWTYAAKAAYHTEEDRLTNELIEEGVFTVTEGIWYHLTNWEDYRYDFNE